MLRLAGVVKRRRSTLAAIRRSGGSFSQFNLHLCWFGFIALHGFCLAYFLTIAWCYWNLSETFLDVWLSYYDLGIGTRHYHTIAVVHGCLAALHFVYLLWMLGWSFKKRRLVVAVFNVFNRSGKNLNEKQPGIICRLYRGALSRIGILDVDGPYFDLVLLFREIVETALQTQQAYRMSLLLPRVELNRGYAAMLVINCWSTAIVHSLYHVDATKRRLLAVLADCALDLVTSVGITTVLLAIYYPDFDADLTSFPPHKWYEDVWIVHVLSEFQILLCKMQVKPWFTTESSCSLLMIDCYESKFSGKASDFTTQWSNFDRKTTNRVVIRHCPNLEVPDLLTDCSQLGVLKIYNSTITIWNKSAALSQSYHPNLAALYLVRVHLPNGELPAGLLDDDFPQNLKDIEFCATNLRSLPEDFDLKWPKFASMYLEKCEFTEVPASLARLAPVDLSLAGNPISTLPPSLIDGTVDFLHVGSTLISELPARITGASNSFVLRVDNTNVSFFWDWIDTLVEHSDIGIVVIHPILATSSPYCADLQRIYDREQVDFSVPWSDGQSRILSNATMENWPILQATVSCDSWWSSTWYPLDFEDVYSGIKDD
ncbi:hypothetical protein AM587_10013775 [Phytophthora nicotianae]|uniref:Uncharacterized protein n=1 Tax=Phytophthora nicotianae TaxID=4792 RepID=A0A0W8CDF0_PHYNI|nr:hypothetical protein AM587_10013775 [Phytophthora nicotianae]